MEIHKSQFSYHSSKYSHTDVITNSQKVSKHRMQFKRSTEYTSCTVLEELSESICALGHLETVDTDVFILQESVEMPE